MHEKINYLYLSKTQARAVHSASDTMKAQIVVLSYKTFNSVILECFLKDKAMKESVS